MNLYKVDIIAKNIYALGLNSKKNYEKNNTNNTYNNNTNYS